ncbi:MAG TPA: 3-hydroxyacyl-ACP dehydratase FabZ family protein [Tepidisphaeraceae bacterium]
MPPQYLFDIAPLDLDRTLFDQEAIRQANPQRGDMEMLNAIVHANPDQGEIIGYKDVKDNEFWVAGHIPGRPLFPGVLMIEAGAQLASFYTRTFLRWQGFIGFGGVDGVKFRSPVLPGQRLYLLGKKLWDRHRRVCCNVQGIVDGSMAFEAQITGTQF